MGLVNISPLIRHIILLLLFSLVPHNGDASTETNNKCLKCHNETRKEGMAKRYIHAPFLEKNCVGCHAANNLSSPKNLSISSSGDESENWTGKNLIPSTSHWFEFESAENSATMILEASYDSTIRSYREISLPPLDELPDIADVFGRNPPKISEVKVLDVKKGIFLTASISWQTDRQTRSRIAYGVKDLRQTTPLNSQLQTEHLETLNDLKSGQTYQFIITAEDAVGNKIKSDIFKFSTATTFSNPITQTCCLVKPLGLENKFFRKGDLYLVNITAAQPVKLFFALLRTDCSLPEASKRPESLEDQSQTNRHIITNAEEAVTLIVCKRCHQTSICNHPVNVYPKGEIKIPTYYPTMADGRINCISCHAPHASNFQYRLIKDHREGLCIGCHNSFNPTGNNLLSQKY